MNNKRIQTEEKKSNQILQTSLGFCNNKNKTKQKRGIFLIYSTHRHNYDDDDDNQNHRKRKKNPRSFQTINTGVEFIYMKKKSIINLSLFD